MKVVITIIGFAIAIGLIVGVIVPIASHGRTTGTNADIKFSGADSSISGIAAPIR